MNKILITILMFMLLILVTADQIQIIAVGDIMPGTNYPQDKYLPAQQGKLLITDLVLSEINSGDLLCGNLEGCLLDDGQGSDYKTTSYLFRIPQKISPVLKYWGFDFLSIANNHSGDFGEKGRQNTRKLLADYQIAFAGQDSCFSTIIHKNGFNIGFIALAPYRGCLDHGLMHKIKAEIIKLQASTDFIVASLHYGGEGDNFLHITGQDEIYHGENRGNTQEIAHTLIDEGVDVIYGHGPHVPRGIELYQERIIAYSLGNFITWARFDLEGKYRPLSPVLKINCSRDGRFISGEIISCRQNYHQGVDIDPQGTAGKVMAALSQEDFGTQLIFTEKENKMLVNKINK